MAERIKKISMIAGAVLSLAGVGALIGIKDFPRPAWASEVGKLAGNLVELDSRVTAQQLEDAKLSFYRNQRQQAEYEAHQVPDYLLEEQTDLEVRIYQLEDRLEDLRNSNGG